MSDDCGRKRARDDDEGLQCRPELQQETGAASGPSKKGRWSKEELARLQDGLALYGKDYQKLADHVRTRNRQQVYDRLHPNAPPGATDGFPAAPAKPKRPNLRMPRCGSCAHCLNPHWKKGCCAPDAAAAGVLASLIMGGARAAAAPMVEGQPQQNDQGEDGERLDPGAAAAACLVEGQQQHKQEEDRPVEGATLLREPAGAAQVPTCAHDAHEPRQEQQPSNTEAQRPVVAAAEAVAAARGMRAELEAAQEAATSGGEGAWSLRARLLRAVWPVVRLFLWALGGPAPLDVWQAVMRDLSAEQVIEKLYELDCLADELVDAARYREPGELAQDVYAAVLLPDTAADHAARWQHFPAPSADGSAADAGLLRALDTAAATGGAESQSLAFHAVRVAKALQGGAALGKAGWRAVKLLPRAKADLVLACGFDMLATQARMRCCGRCAQFLRCMLEIADNEHPPAALP